jgi:hypothetical protein
VQLVTGRRNNEIDRITRFSEVDGEPFKIQVQRLEKKRFLPTDDPDDKVYIMPCTAPASQIIKAVAIIRRELCSNDDKPLKRRKIDAAQEQLFGEGTRYLCNEVRQIMPEQAYKMRQESGFGKDYSAPWFKNEALGHETLQQGLVYSKCTVKS